MCMSLDSKCIVYWTLRVFACALVRETTRKCGCVRFIGSEFSVCEFARLRESGCVSVWDYESADM